MKYIILFTANLLLVGCAIPHTPYQPHSTKGILQGGYCEEQIDSMHYKISFQPNGHTPNKKAEDYTLLRAAELTQEHGYQYFEVLTWKKGTIERYSPYGYSISLSRVGPGRVITYAESDMVIKFKKSADSNNVYNALATTKEVKERYHLN